MPSTLSRDAQRSTLSNAAYQDPPQKPLAVGRWLVTSSISSKKQPSAAHPDMPGDFVFQRQFNLVGEDQCHRFLLDNPDHLIFCKPIGIELFLLHGVNGLSQTFQANGLAGRNEGQREGGVVTIRHGLIRQEV